MSQSAESGSVERPSSPSEVERLGVAGAGTIACGLAASAATRGLEVALWARSRASASRAQSSVAKYCVQLEREEAVDGVRLVPSLSGLLEATLVVEAVSEDPDLKRELLAQLGANLPPATLIATTTSSLSIAELAQASGRPGSFFGLHVFNPVPRMQLVELCFPSGTADGTRARAQAFCESIGKTAVEVPDEAGFVVNRLLFPYLFDAVRLLERTGMEPEHVDACMKLGASHPMGPLELLDLVGLDVAEAIGETLYADTGEPAHRPPGRIKQLIGEGSLGRKAGRGFYDYRETPD